MLCALLSGVASAQAQTQTESRVLTFEEAIKIALKNNVLINTQRNNLELAQAQKLAGIASLGPNVNFNSSATRFNGNSFNQQLGFAVSGVRDNLSGNITAGIQLFNGFSSVNNMRGANAQLDAQSYFVQGTTQDVMNTVALQYLAVLLDIELLKIAKESFQAQDVLLTQVKEQLNLGARSQVDEYNQDALTKGAEYRMVLAEVTLDNDRALLAQSLMIDVITDPFEVQKPLWDPGTVTAVGLNVDSLVNIAKSHRADYLRAEKMEQAQKYLAAASLGNSLPVLSAFAQIGTSYNKQHDEDPFEIDPETGVSTPNPRYPRPFTEQLRTNNFYRQAGLQLQIPIFNGFRNRSLYVQQKISFRNNKLQRENVEILVRNDVLRAVRTFEGSRKAYVVSLNQLEAAENAFVFETERYNLGVTNFVDYTNANRVLIQAQTDKASAEFRLVFQKIALDYAVGTLRPEDFVGAN